MTDPVPAPGDGPTRRRRRRATARPGPAGESGGNAPDTAIPAAGATPTGRKQARQSGKRAGGRGRGEHSGERALRDLVGAGPSLLGVSGALRGRDVNRPTEQDLAEAERDVAIVRRYWKPRA
jgi:hypothetical protein